MRRFFVTVERTEAITFEVDATDLGDALDRYLGDGDEMGSKTLNITVVHSGEVTDAEPR